MIFVNARFLTQDITGVQRFAEELSLSLNTMRDDVVFLSPRNILRQDVAKQLNVKIIGKNSGHIWEQYDLPNYLKRNGSPLLINLCSTAPVFYKNKIVTHHDVTYKRYPQSYSKKFRLLYNTLVPLMIKNSHKLITVSEFSKLELGKYYHVDPHKIAVVYNAVSGKFSGNDKVSADVGRDAYLLAVSSPNYHKNFHSLIEAFSQLDNKDITLKVVGGGSGSFKKQSYLQNFDESRIQFVGRVSDDGLLELYRNAIAFIFPSLYEGFGIPPLEAQACGCPVVSSQAASMPEVLGDSATFFSPLDIHDMSEKIASVLSDPDLRSSLIQNGYENIQRFSWNKSAEQLSHIIDGVLDKR
ncbi:glycosyl transferase family 1 [Lonsdalea populi]|uniref:glycosyltransferase family 4 protein n=2 Tax=Lonsdalea populi TaxID=1172565 RepID=UPI000A2517CC|nr:glycosyltransferase family 1 protein [Lonsdalea populi]OSM95053.1 glycosyl transferase family 1 [Lonsdalea populi]RAT71351.1 glycosyl transferase family 1 [Lonsdalea populi]RAT76682.1 glycosyl transferase family 1 [Lonsdalea populi]RAT78540.1 glycosyl transferase family 1 [Lonsdalea populi]